MTGSLGALILAMLGFTGGHFLFSHPPVRARIVSLIGEGAFLGAYSLLMASFLAWAVFAYKGAPHLLLWDLGPGARHVPLVVMPVALALALIGLTSRNPTAVGMQLEAESGGSTKGIVTVTRHPFLWGAGLWALAHLAPNGDAVSLILFGGMAILAFGGMKAIDYKRTVRSGNAWAAFARSTSVLPFAAALAGRTRVDWKGIGTLRPIIALALYVVLLFVHHRIFGGTPLL